MEYKVKDLLQSNPGLKARKIAAKLHLERHEVNSFLYANPLTYIKNDAHEWSLCQPSFSSMDVTFPKCSWLASEDFEEVLKHYPCLWDKEISAIKLTFLGCNFLLDALGKLLALVNQLTYVNKSVLLDFSACVQSFSYLCRVGFFELIDKKVKVIPEVKDVSCHYGHNSKVMEFGVINPVDPDENIPIQLKKAFIEEAGKEHSSAAFTMISELFGNVRDHSQSPLDGFAALQVYKKTKRIQTVISDSGIGIAGSLRMVLEARYPDLYQEFIDVSAESDALLVKRVFELGRISGAKNNDDKSRGLGLKRSGDIAAKFNARIHIRQENFELVLFYSDGQLSRHEVSYGLQKLQGTHICFDFFLD